MTVRKRRRQLFFCTSCLFNDQFSVQKKKMNPSNTSRLDHRSIRSSLLAPHLFSFFKFSCNVVHPHPARQRMRMRMCEPLILRQRRRARWQRAASEAEISDEMISINFSMQMPGRGRARNSELEHNRMRGEARDKERLLLLTVFPLGG